MSVTIQFTGNSVDVLSEMRRFLGVTAAANQPAPVEVIDQPTAEAPEAEAAEQMVLKDPEGQNYGTYDDEKVLLADLLEMIAAADTLDDLQRLGDNNEPLVGQVKKRTASAIGKAFKERRAVLEKAAADTISAPEGSDAVADKQPATELSDAEKAELKADNDALAAKDAPTADDVKAILLNVIGTEGLGQPAAKVLLGKHGEAARLSELKPEKYKAVYDEARKLIAGAADPLA